MIYMIGGAPRVGKSTLARLILKRNQIPHVGADAIFHMLKHAAPETGITDEIPHQERAEKSFPFYKNLFITPNLEKSSMLLKVTALCQNK